MPNKMIRPCTLWGETFDAMDARLCEINMQGSSSNFEVWVEIWNANECIVVKQCFSDNEIRVAQMEAITTIAKALHAPVLGTYEVYMNIPEGAEFYKGHPINNRETGRTLDKRAWLPFTGWELVDTPEDYALTSSVNSGIFLFKADNDIARNYLHKFNLQGCPYKPFPKTHIEGLCYKYHI